MEAKLFYSDGIYQALSVEDRRIVIYDASPWPHILLARLDKRGIVVVD